MERASVKGVKLSALTLFAFPMAHGTSRKTLEVRDLEIDLNKSSYKP